MLSVLPCERQVLSHGFDFRPVWWQSRTPRRWSSFLDDLPTSDRGRRYHRITRADLFVRAQDESLDGKGRLLVACYAWGTGSNGWLAPRRARVFRDTDAEGLCRKLDDARRQLKAEGPVEAYVSLTDGGPNRIKYMRASFFTKFLYAVDVGTGGRHAKALILDQFVALALNDLHGCGLPERGPWSGDVYRRWIELAVTEAGKASDVDPQVRPDAVEMAYFNHGRQLARERRGGRRR